MKKRVKILLGVLLGSLLISIVYFLMIKKIFGEPGLIGSSLTIALLLLSLISQLGKSKQQRNNELKHMSNYHDSDFNRKF